jgi:hypothetical protein
MSSYIPLSSRRSFRLTGTSVASSLVHVRIDASVLLRLVGTM